MPDFPSRPEGTVPPAGDSAFDELLMTAGQPPQDAAAGLQPVAAVLAALRAGPADGELAGQARALAEFRGTVRVSHRAGRRRARRPVPFRERLSSKLAVITAAAAVAVGGTVGAAYAGALPGPLQRVARDVFAAGPADGRPAPAAVGARRLHARPPAARPLPTGSAAVPPSPVTSHPSWRYGQPGSARKHYQHRRHGHHQGHRDRRPARRQDAQGDQQNGPAARRYENAMARRPGSRRDGRPAAHRNDNPLAHHKGSRLQSPLPTAAAFPSPPAGPDRPGAGGR